MNKMPASFLSVKVNFKEIQDNIRYLDFYSRLLIGQYDRIPEMMGCSICSADVYPHLRAALLELRQAFIPDLTGMGIYASNGIWSSYSPDRAIKAYDLQQALRFQISWHTSAKSSFTSDYKTPFFHGDWKITEEEMKYCHDVLCEFRYPECQTHCSLTQKWSLPCITRSFNDEEKTVCLAVRSDTLGDGKPEIIEMIDISQTVYENIQNEDLVAAFQVLYPEVNVEKYKNLLLDTYNVIKEIVAFEKQRFS